VGKQALLDVAFDRIARTLRSLFSFRPRRLAAFCN
jgi:hypothetical protein